MSFQLGMLVFESISSSVFLFAIHPVAQADYPASPYSLSLEYNIAC